MPELPNYRPHEPLVSRNVFRSQSYTLRDIPSFQEVKLKLPVPILPEHPAWVEMYWRAWEIAWSNLRIPSRASGFVSNYIHNAADDGLYMWDGCFMTQFGLYGRRLFPFMGTLDNLYAKQHDDGFICRTINVHEGYDLYTPFDPDATGPNILAWAEWRHYRATGDDGRLADVFWPLMAYHRWFRDHRSWPSGGYWATGWSSGMSNQPRVPDSAHHHRHWHWVDTTIQTALNCTILRKIALHLEEKALAEELAEEHVRLRQVINGRMWNEESAFYQDIDRDGRFSLVKSIGAFWALLDEDLVPEERLAPFVQSLRESWAFKLPHRVPSQSADSHGYNPETGHYWRGAVWSPTNYMVLKGLRSQGFDALAHEIAVNHLHNIWEVYRHTDTFWENYAPERAAPGDPAKPDFVGWTGLSPIAILLEDVIGLSVDWPQRRVTWDRRLDTGGYWGVRGYPLGGEGHMELVGDRDKVVAITNVPFTLIVREAGESIRLALSSGTTEIELDY